MAAMAENTPLRVNNTNVYLSTAMPVYCAASGLLPMEYIFLPTEVLWRIKANTKESKRKVKNAGLVQEIKERQHFIPKSEKKRLAKNAGKKRWLKKLAKLDNDY